MYDGLICGTADQTAVDQALRVGTRGPPGGSSPAKLLLARRGRRPYRPHLAVAPPCRDPAPGLPRNIARLRPPRRPRRPSRSAAPTAHHVSPGVSGIAPAVVPGHRPVRARCAVAHCLINFSDNGGGWLRFRRPQYSPKRRANDEPPGRPRVPRRNASSTRFQRSPGAARTGPEY
jgi:hypothetical protein